MELSFLGTKVPWYESSSYPPPSPPPWGFEENAVRVSSLSGSAKCTLDALCAQKTRLVAAYVVLVSAKAT